MELVATSELELEGAWGKASDEPLALGLEP